MEAVTTTNSARGTGWLRRPRVILASRPAKALFLAVFVAIALPAVLYKIPPMAGADSAFVVLSGSMEPVLAPGDLIFIEEVPGDSLRVGDIATFKPDPRGDVLVTHRVIEVLPEGSGVRYRTQGDANEDPDPALVSPAMVVGRYDWKIPYWGLLADVLKTRGGYLALVVVPGAAIIVFEMVRLYRELDSSGRDQTAPREEVVEFEVVARRGRA